MNLSTAAIRDFTGEPDWDRLYRGYAWAWILVVAVHAWGWWWSHHREAVVTPAVVPPLVAVEWVPAVVPAPVASPEPPAPTPPAKAAPKPRKPEPKPPPKKVEVPPKAKPPKPAAPTETDDLAQRLKQLRDTLGSDTPTPHASAPHAAPARPAAKASGGGAPTTTARADHLHNPKPPYPAVARARNWEGVSRLRVYVLPSGAAGQVQLAGSSGHDVLDQAALAAVKSWRFVPAKRGDQAIASWVQFPIVWKLQ